MSPAATQLFWHCKELMSALHDRLTLAQLDIHTGIGVSSDLLRAALRLRRVCKKLNCHVLSRANRLCCSRPCSARRAG